MLDEFSYLPPPFLIVSSSTIDVAPVSDLYHDDPQHLILALVENPIVPLATRYRSWLESFSAPTGRGSSARARIRAITRPRSFPRICASSLLEFGQFFAAVAAA